MIPSPNILRFRLLRAASTSKHGLNSERCVYVVNDIYLAGRPGGVSGYPRAW